MRCIAVVREALVVSVEQLAGRGRRVTAAPVAAPRIGDDGGVRPRSPLSPDR